jgi:geranylgeranylglycerol-phosphate geranylgeranyltransferase
MKTLSFIKNYFKSMRLYYCFVTLTAGYAGIFLYNGAAAVSNKVILIFILFFSWGVNQIINDYFNMEEDKVNAPQRPMVSGKLNPKKALLLSGAAITAMIVYSVFQSPLSVIPIICGVAANIFYSKTKNVFLFAFSISCCAWYAYTFLGGGLKSFFTANHGLNFIIFSAMILFNMIMTYFTYFKDFEGDRVAGKRTIQVKYGLKTAAKIGLIVSFLPAILFFLAVCALSVYTYNLYFYASAFAASALFILTGILFYRNKVSANYYFNLKYNFAALCAAQSALVCLGMPTEGFILCVLSIAGVLTIFTLGYKNARE